MDDQNTTPVMPTGDDQAAAPAPAEGGMPTEGAAPAMPAEGGDAMPAEGAEEKPAEGGDMEMPA